MTFTPQPARQPMEINVDGFPITYKRFVFPDGQRHITLADEVRDAEVVITTSITSADDLFDLLLVKDILDEGGNDVALEIRYLLGARMDRPINARQPFTLKIVADVINTAGFSDVIILDPHSKVATDLLHAAAVYPFREVHQVLRQCGDPTNIAIIIPDDGAAKRVDAVIGRGRGFRFVQCHKERDPQTGRLSGFTIDNPEDVNGKVCVIIDDICDGGGTFVGLAKLLRAAGATRIVLFVTHGIFSKGRDLEGIDEVHSTNSFGVDGASYSTDSA